MKKKYMPTYKHIILLTIGLLLSSSMFGVEHEDILSVEFGGVWLQDQYLSPLLYNGFEGKISNVWNQPYSENGPLKRKVRNWEHTGKVGIELGRTRNVPKTNIIQTYGIEGGWGTQYVWSLKLDPNNSLSNGFKIWMGPYLNANVRAKEISGNVNKQYSADVDVSVDARAGIQCCFAGRKTSYRLEYSIQANLIGVDFVPDYWQSYYEIYKTGLEGTVRCAGMWNHRKLDHQLTLDMQFPHSTWRIGVRHQYVEYGGANLWFSNEEVSAVIGTVFNYNVRGNKSLTE